MGTDRFHEAQHGATFVAAEMREKIEKFQAEVAELARKLRSANAQLGTLQHRIELMKKHHIKAERCAEAAEKRLVDARAYVQSTIRVCVDDVTHTTILKLIDG